MVPGSLVLKALGFGLVGATLGLIAAALLGFSIGDGIGLGGAAGSAVGISLTRKNPRQR